MKDRYGNLGINFKSGGDSCLQRTQEEDRLCNTRWLVPFQKITLQISFVTSTFSAFNGSGLGTAKWSKCLCYLNNILVFGRTLNECNEWLKQVLAALELAGLTLNLKKCLFGLTSVTIKSTGRD